MIDLKARFGSAYHVIAEESAETPGQTAEERLWLWIIPGRRGHIYVQSADRLAATTDSPSRRRMLEALPGTRVHQRGDAELTVTFDPSLTEQVAQIIQCHRRRKLSDAHRSKLVAAGSGFRFAPGSNAPITGHPGVGTEGVDSRDVPPSPTHGGPAIPALAEA